LLNQHNPALPDVHKFFPEIIFSVAVLWQALRALQIASNPICFALCQIGGLGADAQIEPWL
jgi:hypothetical protein